MTPQQAIKTIKHGCIYRDKRGGEALTVAVEALKKQIPKKPILDVIFPSGVEWYLCPVCNHNGIEKVGCYCHNCGQALDWGDTK